MTEPEKARPIHRRSIEHRSFRLDDGSLSLESRLIDRKGYDMEVGFGRPLPAGEPVHDMTIQLVLGPDGLIRDLRVRMDSAPFDVCPEVIRRFESLKGASMGRGWNALLSERLGGNAGCRHLVDLLRGMATVAFQSQARGEWTPEGVNYMRDSCHAFRGDGEVMARLEEKLGMLDEQNNE